MAKVLIAGAGPVGLTAAIELSRQGHQVSIFDSASAPTQLSRAIGINSKTLALLEHSGMTERLLANGIKIYHASFYCHGKRKVYADLQKIGHKYNFMLALPQDETETLLEKRLQKFGITVERNTEFVSLTQDAAQVTATLKCQDTEYQHTSDYLLGADGAHSLVRKNLGLEFPGFTYPDPWNLADIYMTWAYRPDEAYSFIQNDGKVLVVIPIGPDRYRVIGTMPDILAALPLGSEIKSVTWQSSFKVSCRQVQNYTVGRVFLAGDAAHVHSPVGGRGMNLGIEDACVFAEKMTQGQLDSYSAERYQVGRHVIRTTDSAFKLITTTNPLLQFIRNNLIFPLINQPTLQKYFFKAMLGIE